VIRICSICARGGSKGVKNKNITNLLGKPLIAHSIIQAKEAGIFQAVVVSSDSDEILSVAKAWGADFIVERPAELAQDTSPKIPVIQHCVQTIERLTNLVFDTMVDLDATSPLRSVQDIIQAVNLLEESDVSNVITGMPSRRSPYFNLVELNREGFARLSKKLEVSITRRQDSPKCYDMNASIYAWKRVAFFSNNSVFNKDTLLYEMPEERSIDIDTQLDFEFVEFLAQKRGTLA
jgi:CMP-N,N'-diacetyllegionaminic acid synthase